MKQACIKNLGRRIIVMAATQQPTTSYNNPQQQQVPTTSTHNKYPQQQPTTTTHNNNPQQQPTATTHSNNNNNPQQQQPNLLDLELEHVDEEGAAVAVVAGRQRVHKGEEALEELPPRRRVGVHLPRGCEETAGKGREG